MKSKSGLEREFLFYLNALAPGLPAPEQEYKFAQGRRYRADFAWSNKKIIVEIEGAIWTQGRHTRGSGYVKDCEKYNLATELGWRVLRYTSEHFKNAHEMIAQIERLYNERTMV